MLPFSVLFKILGDHPQHNDIICIKLIEYDFFETSNPINPAVPSSVHSTPAFLSHVTVQCT